MDANVEFDALKDMARFMYLINFEALASVANDEDALEGFAPAN
jgi:hypothetical protein